MRACVFVCLCAFVYTFDRCFKMFKCVYASACTCECARTLPRASMHACLLACIHIGLNKGQKHIH